MQRCGLTSRRERGNHRIKPSMMNISRILGQVLKTFMRHFHIFLSELGKDWVQRAPLHWIQAVPIRTLSSSKRKQVQRKKRISKKQKTKEKKCSLVFTFFFYEALVSTLLYKQEHWTQAAPIRTLFL